MTYVKIAFVLTEGEPPVAWWVNATSDNIGAAYRHAINLCQGTWLCGVDAQVLAVTTEQPAEDVFPLREIRERVKAANAGAA